MMSNSNYSMAYNV